MLPCVHMLQCFYFVRRQCVLTDSPQITPNAISSALSLRLCGFIRCAPREFVVFRGSFKNDPRNTRNNPSRGEGVAQFFTSDYIRRGTAARLTTKATAKITVVS